MRYDSVYHSRATELAPVWTSFVAFTTLVLLGIITFIIIFWPHQLHNLTYQISGLQEMAPFKFQQLAFKLGAATGTGTVDAASGHRAQMDSSPSHSDTTSTFRRRYQDTDQGQQQLGGGKMRNERQAQQSASQACLLTTG